MKFNLLTVKEIVKLTDDSVQITFDVPADLQADYNFLPGQYITLDIDGQRRGETFTLQEFADVANAWASLIK